jgi:RNA polymerase sigma factor (sigma-70 family)
MISMSEQNRQISEIVAEERSRLRNFIRRRVPDPSDAEDIVQEVFYELVEANRLLMPIEHVTGWLFRVARNRITDLFRKKRPETFSDRGVEDEDGEVLRIEDLLPSRDAGPEALYVRSVLLEELEFALDELPDEQREGIRGSRTGGAQLQRIVGGKRRKRQHATFAQALRGASSAGTIAEPSRRVYEELRNPT